MSTDRLYYRDSYLTEFDATVLHVEHVGGKPVVVLDRTGFYPTSGGQPFDVGGLGGARVLDVVDRDDGTIGHMLDRELVEGSSTHGAIDWTRRFDHMQQHTGQHLLSSACDRLLGARTVGFHLGVDSSTIDLNQDVAAGQIAQAEADANRIVWENRAVDIRFVEAAEAASMGLRKESARSGTLRLIEIAGYDRSACGGTHVARTGAVGIIAVQSRERFRGGTRVSFACGGRALAAFGVLRDVVSESVRRLSVLPGDLPAAIERAQAEIKDLKKILTARDGRLAVFQAAELAARAVVSGSTRLVAEVVQADAPGLKNMATAIVANQGYAVVLVSSSSSPPLVVVGRSKDLALDVRDVVRELIGRFGGKGGGTAELAQGGGFSATPEEILGRAREIISAAG